MKHEHYRYIDTAIGGVHNRNNVVAINESGGLFIGEECYKTVYRFPGQYKQYWEMNIVNGHKSVSGYNGYCYADYFVIDIDTDNGGDLQDSINSSIIKVTEIVHHLEVVYDFDLINNSYLFFSGCKGFHILIPEKVFGEWQPSPDLPKIHRALAEKLFNPEQVDLSIYDINRLFRVVSTRHGKSKLFKIQLQWNTLFNESSSIIKDAVYPSNIWILDDIQQNEGLTELFNSIDVKSYAKKEPDKIIINNNGLNDIFSGAPTGNRRNTIMKIAGKYSRVGIPEEYCLDAVCKWNEKLENKLTQEQLDREVHSAYRQYADKNMSDNPEILDEVKEEETKSEMLKKVFNMKDAGKQYLQYLNRMQGNYIKVGVPVIDKHFRGISPGTVLGIMAMTSNFKTTVGHNITSVNCRDGNIGVLFSLEMTARGLFERQAQMDLNSSGEEIQAIFTGTHETLLDTPQEVIDVVYQKNKNLYIVDDTNLSYDEMSEFCYVIEEKLLNGKKIGFVFIDFMQRINAQGRSRIEVMGNVARGAKDFAKRIDKPVILAIQIGRGDKPKDRGSARLHLSSARDSGEIEEACDFLLGQYVDEENRNTLKMQVLKNRQGDTFINPTGEHSDEIELVIDRKTLRINPIYKP